MYLDHKNNITNNKLIRKAINYGFDREKMIKYLRNGIGTPAVNGFIPSGLPSFNNLEGYRYKPELANAILEIKLRQLAKLEQIKLEEEKSMLVDEQKEIEKILGSSSRLKTATLRQLKSSGELDIFRASWVADYPDAENYLSLFYSPNFTPNGPNYTHFKNVVFDSLYVKQIYRKTKAIV